MTRMPLRRAVATSSRSASFPLVPVSANPAEMITTPRTCFSAHSATTSGTPVGRHDDQGEVDRVGNVEHASGTRARPRPTTEVGLTG